MNIPVDQFATRARLKQGSREWSYYTEAEKRRAQALKPYKKLEQALKGWARGLEG